MGRAARLSMRALVTGGGGFLGRAITEQLLERGDAVTILSRGRYPEVEALGADAIQMDLAEPDGLVEALAGIDVVFLNEFANAHTLYPDPDLRAVRDLDILVALHDIKPLVNHLGGHGFRAADEDTAGAISLAANDGCTRLNLYLGISGVAAKPTIAAEQVANASRTIELDGAEFRFPSPEHTLVLAASVAAKARFGRLCVLDLLDVVMLLRLDAGIDWLRVQEIAGSSRLDKPLRTLLSLLVELGLGANGLPAKLIRPPRWPANGKFRHLADNYRELFQSTGLRAGV